MKFRIFGPIRVLDHRDGSTYPFEILRDWRFTMGRYRVSVPGRRWRSGKAREGFRTDFASIPGRRSLKRLLEPQRLIPCSEESLDHGPHVVYVYVLGAGGLPVMVGRFQDPVAAPAVAHDWFYSTHLVPRVFADKVFRDLLRANGVWSSGVMYHSVRWFGGFAYDRCDLEEMRHDRDLGETSIKEWFEENPDPFTGPVWRTVLAG